MGREEKEADKLEKSANWWGRRRRGT